MSQHMWHLQLKMGAEIFNLSYEDFAEQLERNFDKLFSKAKTIGQMRDGGFILYYFRLWIIRWSTSSRWSIGVTVIPQTDKNQRSRCSLLVELASTEGTTRVLIDTSPDMRSQLLKANVGKLDGVVYTHEHADHVHGIDDLRMIFFNMRRRINVWADKKPKKRFIKKFGYTFIQAEGSPYPPILENVYDKW